MGDVGLDSAAAIDNDTDLHSPSGGEHESLEDLVDDHGQGNWDPPSRVASPAPQQDLEVGLVAPLSHTDAPLNAAIDAAVDVPISDAVVNVSVEVPVDAPVNTPIDVTAGIEDAQNDDIQGTWP
jgi:hypothetical protein